VALSLTLTDGTTTLDLTGGLYTAGHWAPKTPEIATDVRSAVTGDGDGVGRVRYRDVVETIPLAISASSKAALQAAIQNLQGLLAAARSRTNVHVGPQVFLQLRVDGDVDTYRSEVLLGRFEMDPDALTTWTGSQVTGTLYLTRRFYWEGPETSCMSSKTLRITDGTSPYNAADFGSIAGVDGMPTPIKLTLTNSGSAEYFSHFYLSIDGRVGLATNEHLLTPTTATKSWGNIGTAHNSLLYVLTIPDAVTAKFAGELAEIVAAIPSVPSGVWLRASLQYEESGVYYELAAGREIYTSDMGGRELYNFGTVSIPPKNSPATTGLRIIITAYASTAGSITLDFVSLQPGRRHKHLYQRGFITPPGASVVDDGLTGERYVLIGADKHPWMRGSEQPLMVTAGRSNRLYVMCTTSSGFDSGVVFTASATYRPRRLTV